MEINFFLTSAAAEDVAVSVAVNGNWHALVFRGLERAVLAHT